MPKVFPNSGLTDAQRRMFDFIVKYIKEHAMSPTIREIGDALGLHSPNGVMYHVKALQRKGWIAREPSWNSETGHTSGKSRTIRILMGEVCHCCNGLGRILSTESTPDA